MSDGASSRWVRRLHAFFTVVSTGGTSLVIGPDRKASESHVAGCTCVRHRDGVWFYVVADPECPAHGDLA